MYISCGNGGNVPNPSVLNAAQINGARSVATRCVRFAAAPKELSIETRSSNSALAQGFSELSADPIVESKGYECRQNPLIRAEKSSLTTWGKMSEELDVLFHNVNSLTIRGQPSLTQEDRCRSSFRFQHVKGRVLN